MTTSALAFQQLLQMVSSRAKDNEPFLSAVATTLDLSGAERKIEALSVLLKLLRQIGGDVDKLDLDEKSKAHIKGFLAPFAGIESLSQIHMKVGNAKKNFLRADFLVNLINVHTALAGRVNRFEDRTAAEELVGQVKEALNAINDSTFDPAIKELLTSRLLQITAILNNLQYFGLEKLSKEVDALAGAIVIRVPADKRQENKGAMSKIMSIVDGAETLVSRASQWSRNVGTLTDSVLKVGSFTSGLLGYKE